MRLLAPIALALLIAACGNNSTNNGADMSAGACELPRMVCSGSCVDLTSNPLNCGSCGTKCRYGDVCMGSKCVLVCDSTLTACGNPGSCVDTMRDPQNCGACANACLPGHACQAGTCVLSCQPELTNCGGTCTNLKNDPAHCGDCKTICPMGNTCTAGACAVACGPGETLCDADADAGTAPACANLQSDDAHCGDCKTACAVGSTCQKGHCVISCPPGFDNCGGQCANLKVDSANCGTCGAACSMGQVCTAGACASPCQKPLVACQNGCVDTRFDPANCGKCGAACMMPNSAAACVNGQCTVGVCSAGFADCDQNPANGCEVNLGSDANNCVGCGQACVVANGVGQCAMGCTVGSCAMGFADCDAMYANGCEVNLNTNTKNCGTCGNTCPVVANAVPGCAAGTCGIGSCNAGFTDCDKMSANGCEVNTAADPKNCGACGTACPAVANAAAGCAAGKCGIGACTMGFTDCNGFNGDGCECNTGAGFACIGSACVAQSCRALQVAGAKFDGVYPIAPDGMNIVNAYCDMTYNGGGWTLLMKLSAGSFCFGDPNWTNLSPLNEAALTNIVVPAVNDPDAKSRAFYQMNDVTAIRFVTTHNQVTVTFTKPSNAMNLMTTNTVPFAAYPDYTAWKAAFLQDRSGGPIFLRGGVPVTAGYACRTNTAATPLGCGQLCTFCYVASDSGACGGVAAGNDTACGVGLNRLSCSSNLANCSTAGSWSDSTQRTLVYGR